MVYPRVGGGNVFCVSAGICVGGLSPRGRGKPVSAFPREDKRRSIPAWAGETQMSARISFIIGVYPRVGGGNRRGARNGLVE